MRAHVCDVPSRFRTRSRPRRACVSRARRHFYKRSVRLCACVIRRVRRGLSHKTLVFTKNENVTTTSLPLCLHDRCARCVLDSFPAGLRRLPRPRSRPSVSLRQDRTGLTKRKPNRRPSKVFQSFGNNDRASFRSRNAVAMIFSGLRPTERSAGVDCAETIESERAFASLELSSARLPVSILRARPTRTFAYHDFFVEIVIRTTDRRTGQLHEL